MSKAPQLTELHSLAKSVLTEQFNPEKIVSGDDDRTPTSWMDLEKAVRVINGALGPLANAIKDRDPAKVIGTAGDMCRVLDAIRWLRPETIAVFKDGAEAEVAPEPASKKK